MKGAFSALLVLALLQALASAGSAFSWRSLLQETVSVQKCQWNYGTCSPSILSALQYGGAKSNATK